MSLTEPYIQQGMYAEAESLLEHAKSAYHKSGAAVYNARINLFHISVNLARISHEQFHWEEAILRWKHGNVSGGAGESGVGSSNVLDSYI